LPQATDIIDELKQKGYGMTSTALNVDEAKEQILNNF
jgi:Cobalt ATP-binding cassette C terminal.